MGAPKLQEKPSIEGVFHLQFESFRNFPQLSLKGLGQMNVLYGPNGSGKTNILEALSLLNGTRGFRRATLSDLCHQGEAPTLPWVIQTQVGPAENLQNLATGLSPDAWQTGQEKRIGRFEGQDVRPLSQLAYRVGIISLTPQEDDLFREGAGRRRRFFDRWVSTQDPTHQTRLNRYEQAMAERNKLLKQGIFNEGWLGGLEDIMATESLAIHHSRVQLAEQLNQAIMLLNPAFPQGQLSLLTNLSKLAEDCPAVMAEEKFRQLLRENRPLDAQSGGAQEGAHKLDLNVIFCPKNIPASQGSTGEQKALILSLTLAYALVLKGQFLGVPLLLLDEVVAHLDENRREALFKTLMDLEVQTWMTGTEKTFFKGLVRKAEFFYVRDGHVAHDKE